MADLAVNDLIQVNVVCSAGNQFSQNVLWYQVSGDQAVNATLEQFADHIANHLGGAYRSCLSSAARFEGVKVGRRLPNPTDFYSSTIGNGIGESGANLLPPQTSGLIRKRTGSAGRRKRGRMYVPFPSEEQSGADGKPTASYLLALGNLADKLVEVIDLASGPINGIVKPQVRSFANGSWERLTQTTINDVWCTMRRRSYAGRGDSNPLS